jgi:hypothetical protein
MRYLGTNVENTSETRFDCPRRSNDTDTIDVPLALTDIGMRIALSAGNAKPIMTVDHVALFVTRDLKKAHFNTMPYRGEILNIAQRVNRTDPALSGFLSLI